MLGLVALLINLNQEQYNCLAAEASGGSEELLELRLRKMHCLLSLYLSDAVAWLLEWLPPGMAQSFTAGCPD
jgi:hypothetical protein